MNQWIYGTLLSNKPVCNQSPSVLAFLPLPVSSTTTAASSAACKSTTFRSNPWGQRPVDSIVEGKDSFVRPSCCPDYFNLHHLLKHNLSVSKAMHSLSHTIDHSCSLHHKTMHAIKIRKTCFSFIHVKTPNWRHDRTISQSCFAFRQTAQAWSSFKQHLGGLSRNCVPQI